MPMAVVAIEWNHRQASLQERERRKCTHAALELAGSDAGPFHGGGLNLPDLG